ncbi:10463_t:CDS:1 [Acaulospora colombiana]|uniref:10463_t:CDS:1 n=1 Tax=Acaulospora colombiana TaxID=27376 RepID=A0ACA9JUX4_9GLOM|nr:10463_t:CDS:1 [Acaulospora colombiana]
MLKKKIKTKLFGEEPPVINWHDDLMPASDAIFNPDPLDMIIPIVLPFKTNPVNLILKSPKASIGRFNGLSVNSKIREIITQPKILLFALYPIYRPIHVFYVQAHDSLTTLCYDAYQGLPLHINFHVPGTLLRRFDYPDGGGVGNLNKILEAAQKYVDDNIDNQELYSSPIDWKSGYIQSYLDQGIENQDWLRLFYRTARARNEANVSWICHRFNSKDGGKEIMDFEGFVQRFHRPILWRSHYRGNGFKDLFYTTLRKHLAKSTPVWLKNVDFLEIPVMKEQHFERTYDEERKQSPYKSEKSTPSKDEQRSQNKVKTEPPVYEDQRNKSHSPNSEKGTESEAENKVPPAHEEQSKRTQSLNSEKSTPSKSEQKSQNKVKTESPAHEEQPKKTQTPNSEKSASRKNEQNAQNKIKMEPSAHEEQPKKTQTPNSEKSTSSKNEQKAQSKTKTEPSAREEQPKKTQSPNSEKSNPKSQNKAKTESPAHEEQPKKTQPPKPEKSTSSKNEQKAQNKTKTETSTHEEQPKKTPSSNSEKNGQSKTEQKVKNKTKAESTVHEEQRKKTQPPNSEKNANSKTEQKAKNKTRTEPPNSGKSTHNKTEQKAKNKAEAESQRNKSHSPNNPGHLGKNQRKNLQESQKLHDPKGYYKLLGLDHLILVPDDDGIIKFAFTSTLKRIEASYNGHMHLSPEEKREKDEKTRLLVEARNALRKCR